MTTLDQFIEQKLKEFPGDPYEVIEWVRQALRECAERGFNVGVHATLDDPNQGMRFYERRDAWLGTCSHDSDPQGYCRKCETKLEKPNDTQP